MKAKTSNILTAVIFMVLGILLCCSVIDPNSLINWMIAIVLIIGGSTLIIVSLVLSLATLSDAGLIGGFLLAFGVFMLPPVTGGIDWMGAISIVMMVIGCLFLLDAILGFIYTPKEVSRNITVLVLGVALFTIGICLYLVDGFRQYAGLMLGIFFIIYSILAIISIIIKRNLILIEIKRAKKEVDKANR